MIIITAKNNKKIIVFLVNHENKFKKYTLILIYDKSIFKINKVTFNNTLLSRKIFIQFLNNFIEIWYSFTRFDI